LQHLIISDILAPAVAINQLSERKVHDRLQTMKTNYPTLSILDVGESDAPIPLPNVTAKILKKVSIIPRY
jgi:hypothetical protein